jgi:hypothetical protein
MTNASVRSVLSPIGSRRASARDFLRHLFEMLVAMVVGMVVLGALVSAAFALLGHANLFHYAALRALVMASNMTVGMSVWMRYRGHNWPRVTEMAGAMFAPFLVLLVPFWTAVISGGVLLVGGHLLMLPCMVGVMLYRHEEYSQDHRRHEHTSVAVSGSAHTTHS